MEGKEYLNVPEEGQNHRLGAANREKCGHVLEHSWNRGFNLLA